MKNRYPTTKNINHTTKKEEGKEEKGEKRERKICFAKP